MLIYIHGLNSSSLSGKARQLKAWMEARGLGRALACPNLPDRPAAAIALLESLVTASRGTAKVVGSSLGGYYATWLAEKHGLKAILVNPCVACNEKLAGEVGRVQKNWHTGAEYEFTRGHLRELAGLRLQAITQPERYLLLVETGDEVLDYREAVEYYRGARQEVLEGGDHGFSRFDRFIPEILCF